MRRCGRARLGMAATAHYCVDDSQHCCHANGWFIRQPRNDGAHEGSWPAGQCSSSTGYSAPNAEPGSKPKRAATFTVPSLGFFGILGHRFDRDRHGSTGVANPEPSNRWCEYRPPYGPHPTHSSCERSGTPLAKRHVSLVLIVVAGQGNSHTVWVWECHSARR